MLLGPSKSFHKIQFSWDLIFCFFVLRFAEAHSSEKMWSSICCPEVQLLCGCPAEYHESGLNLPICLFWFRKKQ